MGDPDQTSGDLDRAIAEANESPAAKGPPPLQSFGLVLHHDGSWTHEGHPFRNRRLREKFDVSVRYLPDEGGVYVVQIGHFRGLIEVEEAGFFVLDLHLGAGRVRLSDTSSDVLDVPLLSTSPIDGAIICQVKRALVPAGVPARFSHRAQAELLNAVSDDGASIEVGGNRVELPDL